MTRQACWRRWPVARQSPSWIRRIQQSKLGQWMTGIQASKQDLAHFDVLSLSRVQN